MVHRSTVAAALAAALIGGFVSSAALAGQKPTPMVPLIGMVRENTPDRAFVLRAAHEAIAAMESSRTEIARASTDSVQTEAVRSFNTAAAAYNGLADIASQRNMTLSTPSSLFIDDTSPTLTDGGQVGPADVAYFNARQAALLATIQMYRAEASKGHDPLVVSFAKRMAARLDHDLALMTLDVEHLDHDGYGDRPSPSTNGAS
jgi:hypothetical protein